MQNVPRGIRNNNPGNVEADGDAWQGMIGSDGRFCIFDKPGNGIRAIAKLMIKYQKKYSLNTIRKIINRWAPPSENITSAYVLAVAKTVGIGPDDVVRSTDLASLVRGIIQHENGQQPYTLAQIQTGVDAA